MIGKLIQMTFKEKWYDYIDKNLEGVMKVIGLLIKVNLLILLVLITCTCNGPRLMLGKQTFEKQTDYSLYSGKLVKQINDATECATSKTDGLVFHSWHPAKLSTLPLSLVMLDTVSYQSLGLMQRKCLPIKLYRFQSTTRFSSNRFKMVWIDQKLNLHTGFQLVDLQEKN